METLNYNDIFRDFLVEKFDLILYSLVYNLTFLKVKNWIKQCKMSKV